MTTPINTNPIKNAWNSYTDVLSKQVENPVAKLALSALKVLSYLTIVIPLAFFAVYKLSEHLSLTDKKISKISSNVIAPQSPKAEASAAEHLKSLMGKPGIVISSTIDKTLRQDTLNLFQGIQFDDSLNQDGIPFTFAKDLTRIQPGQFILNGQDMRPSRSNDSKIIENENKTIYKELVKACGGDGITRHLVHFLCQAALGTPSIKVFEFLDVFAENAPFSSSCAEEGASYNINTLDPNTITIQASAAFSVSLSEDPGMIYGHIPVAFQLVLPKKSLNDEALSKRFEILEKNNALESDEKKQRLAPLALESFTAKITIGSFKPITDKSSEELDKEYPESIENYENVIEKSRKLSSGYQKLPTDFAKRKEELKKQFNKSDAEVRKLLNSKPLTEKKMQELAKAQELKQAAKAGLDKIETILSHKDYLDLAVLERKKSDQAKKIINLKQAAPILEEAKALIKKESTEARIQTKAESLYKDAGRLREKSERLKESDEAESRRLKSQADRLEMVGDSLTETAKQMDSPTIEKPHKPRRAAYEPKIESILESEQENADLVVEQENLRESIAEYKESITKKRDEISGLRQKIQQMTKNQGISKADKERHIAAYEQTLEGYEKELQTLQSDLAKEEQALGKLQQDRPSL